MPVKCIYWGISNTYTYENGWSKVEHGTIIGEDDLIYITGYKNGTKIGFHKSRLIKIIEWEQLSMF